MESGGLVATPTGGEGGGEVSGAPTVSPIAAAQSRPSPEDEDEGGPSSVEAVADPADIEDGHFSELEDFDPPEVAFAACDDAPATAAAAAAVATATASYEDESDPLAPNGEGIGDLFDLILNEDNVKSETAVPGVCGLKNIGNTCYMNSGLQCLLGTPPITDFFLRHFEKSDKCDKLSIRLSEAFSPLTRDVWSGDYSALRPVEFKESLSKRNIIFMGTQQHDCQEFLAILLDALHEELNLSHSGEGGGKAGLLLSKSECNTSMELNSSVSVVAADGAAAVNSNGTGDNCQNHGAKLVSNWLGESEEEEDYEKKRSKKNDSATGSPRSFDSQSSLSIDESGSIRHRPIPKELKTDSKNLMEDDDDDLELDLDNDSTASSPSQQQPQQPLAPGGQQQLVPTSNLVAVDTLKKKAPTLKTDKKEPNNEMLSVEKNSSSVALEDYILKENKTLNVNVLDTEGTAQVKNNEITFDSDKFARAHENARPQETIDNLGLRGSAGSPSSLTSKRAKEMDLSDEDGGDEKPKAMDVFGSIKRIKLDSQDREKNVQLALERKIAATENGSDITLDDDEEEAMLENGAGGPEPTDVGEGPRTAASSSVITPRSATDSTLVDTRHLKEAIEAERYWEKYLSTNDTVVARTFQGLFKNTVVCSVCAYPSVSFEPFMYLAVPLPNAAVIQKQVTFVSPSLPTVTYLLELTQADCIRSMKTSVSSLTGVDADRMAVVEVTEHRIHFNLEDWAQIRYIGEDKEVCVIERIVDQDAETPEESAKNSQFMPDVSMETAVPLADTSSDIAAAIATVVEEAAVPPPLATATVITASGDEGEQVDQIVPSLLTVDVRHDMEMSETPVSHTISESPSEEDEEAPTVTAAAAKATTATNSSMTMDQGIEDESQNLSCVICMEELPVSQLRQHNACECRMCLPCLDRTLEHHESDPEVPRGQIRCPGCRENAEPAAEFVALDQVSVSKPRKRVFNLQVLFRRVIGAKVNLFGHPSLLRVPNQISGHRLHSLIKPLIRNDSYDLIVTDSSGKTCSRCLYGSNLCVGCVSVPRGSESFLLQSADTIAVTYNPGPDDLEELYRPLRDSSMSKALLPSELTLEDCLDAFSENETLDGNNPWHCPVCRKNRTATKTLTIWKLPDFLIVYLKRFVYVSGTSCKLEKPVSFSASDLDLTRFLSGPLRARPRFDLYACVNHFGSVGSGHYTAFVRHATSHRWRLFNDADVQDRAPGDINGDKKAAYILFYERKGASSGYELPLCRQVPKEEPSEKNEESSPDSGIQAVNKLKISDLKTAT